MTIYTIIENLPEWADADTSFTSPILGYFKDREVAEKAVEFLREAEEERLKEKFQGGWRKYAKRYHVAEEAVAESAEEFVEAVLAERAETLEAVAGLGDRLKRSSEGIDLFDFDLDEELGLDLNDDEDLK